MSEPEIEYVIGHDIDDPYETRNEFVNEEKLFAIKQKMDRRPLVNSDLSQIGKRIDVGERLQLQHAAHMQIPMDSAETEMHIMPAREGRGWNWRQVRSRSSLCLFCQDIC